MSLIFQIFDNVDVLAAGLFQRKFGGAPPPPDWPHHICGFWQQPGSLSLLSYVHFGRFEDICLVGGMCTDGDLIRSLPDAARAALRQYPSIAQASLEYGFETLKDRFDAFFGLVENPRALEVDLAAGFVETEHRHLVRYLPRPLSDDRLQALTAKALGVGPF